MRPRATCGVTLLVLTLASTACGGDEPRNDKVVEPRGREHPRRLHAGSGDPNAAAALTDPSQAPARDPEIDRALELIRTSGLRFLAPEPDSPEGEGDEYTAEQFASMLETKRDWIGYDITKFEPWLREIATSSFLDRVAYRVVLDDGTTREFQPWLVERLAAPPAPPSAP